MQVKSGKDRGLKREGANVVIVLVSKRGGKGAEGCPVNEWCVCTGPQSSSWRLDNTATFRTRKAKQNMALTLHSLSPPPSSSPLFYTWCSLSRPVGNCFYRFLVSFRRFQIRFIKMQLLVPSREPRVKVLFCLVPSREPRDNVLSRPADP